MPPLALVKGVNGDGAFRNFGGHSNGPVIGGVLGSGIAVVACSVIDAGVFGFMTEWRTVPASSFRWQPVLDVGPDRGTLGVGAIF